MSMTDEDIKIYDAQDDGELPEEGEAAAAEFLFHKEQGNFVKTRELGEELAQTLLDAAPEMAGQRYRAQKLTLLSFLALDCLADTMDCHMLQRSADTAFRRAIEARDPELFGTITDSTAYTYFMLNDRQGGERTDGQVLADLCGEDNIALVVEGDRLAAAYRRVFTEIIKSADFAPFPCGE